MNCIFPALYAFAFCFVMRVPDAYSQSSRALIDISRYFNSDVVPGIDAQEFVSLHVDWSIGGKEQTLMNAGLTALDKKLYSQAVENFQELVNLKPALVLARYYLAVSLRADYRLSEAERVFRQSLTMSDKCWQCYLEFANTLQLLGRWEEAKKGYEYSIELNDKAAEAYFYLGHAEVVRSNEKFHMTRTYPPEGQTAFTKALSLYQKSTQVDPQFAKGYVMQGLMNLPYGNKSEDAVRLFNKALEIDSTCKEALFWRGLYYSHRNNAGLALRDWDLLVRSHPHVTRFLFFRGILNIELGRYDEAFSDIRKTVLSHEANENRYRGDGSPFDHRLDIKFAMEYAVRNSYGLKPGASFFFKKGFCLMVRGDYAQSIVALEKAKSLDSAAVVFFTLAISHEYLGNDVDAYSNYHWALERDKDIFDAYKKRALYRSKLKDWRGAISDYGQMLRLRPESIQTFRLRACTKVAGKDWYGAIYDFTQFIKQDSSDVRVLLERAYCYDKIAQFDAAGSDYQAAIAIDPSNAQAYDIAASYYLKNNDSTRALEVRKLKVRNLPDNLNYLFDLIELQALMRKPEARKNLQLVKGADLDQVAGSAETYRDRKRLVEGLLNYARGDYEQASKIFSKILADHPNMWKAKWYQAKSEIAMGRSDPRYVDVVQRRKPDDFEVVAPPLFAEEGWRDRK
jgi:tetratricopeptide (TPR) repeat protein